MVNLRVCSFLGICLAAFAVHAADPSETCNDMYPADSYESDERYILIQECMQAYSTDTAPDAESDPGYYEGTVEEFVEQIPSEQPATE